MQRLGLDRGREAIAHADQEQRRTQAAVDDASQLREPARAYVAMPRERARAALSKRWIHEGLGERTLCALSIHFSVAFWISRYWLSDCALNVSLSLRQSSSTRRR